MLRSCFKTIFRAASACFQHLAPAAFRSVALLRTSNRASPEPKISPFRFPKIVLNQLLKKNAALALIFYLAIGSSFVSCTQKPEEEPGRKGSSPAYFNVNDFLQKQVAYLQRTNPAVEKTVTNGSLPPEREIIKHINWEKELAFFLDADINKNAWRDTFQGDTAVNAATGATIYTYRSPVVSKAVVKLLRVETLGNGRVSSLQIVTRQQNPLFYAGRTLMLACNPAAPDNPVKTYSVTGVQKPVFADSLTYSVSVNILY